MRKDSEDIHLAATKDDVDRILHPKRVDLAGRLDQQSTALRDRCSTQESLSALLDGLGSDDLVKDGLARSMVHQPFKHVE